MEEIVTCDICKEQFDSLHFIPKILECGHTFCSPCLIKVFQSNPVCPNCRTEMKGIESSLRINYTSLQAVDIYNSMERSESDIVTSIENMKKKCIEEKDKLSDKKSVITLALGCYDEFLAKLEELTVSERLKVDSLSAIKILNEVEDSLQKTDHFMRCCGIKSSASILLSSFENSERYLIEIFSIIQNGKKVFSMHKINEEFKYGRVSLCENKLFFHSLSLSEVPPDSSLIWLDELKNCASNNNLHSFIKIFCKKTNIASNLIIEIFPNFNSSNFIKLCTGECGPSCKDSFSGEGSAKSWNINFSAMNSVKNSSLFDSGTDYNFNDADNYDFKCLEDQVLVSLLRDESTFKIFLATKYKNINNIVGKVISPTKLNDSIKSDHFSSLKVVDCGIMIKTCQVYNESALGTTKFIFLIAIILILLEGPVKIIFLLGTIAIYFNFVKI